MHFRCKCALYSAARAVGQVRNITRYSSTYFAEAFQGKRSNYPQITTSQKRFCVPVWANPGRLYTNLAATDDTIPSPALEGTPKEYPPKIVDLVHSISQLTIAETAELNELLKKTLNIADAPMMAMGGMPMMGAGAEAEEEEEPQQQKMSFNVKLVKFSDTEKVKLIKEIKAQMEGTNLVQAKKFVESLPQTVRSDIPKDEAEKLKTALEAAGGTVEIE